MRFLPIRRLPFGKYFQNPQTMAKQNFTSTCCRPFPQKTKKGSASPVLTPYQLSRGSNTRFPAPAVQHCNLRSRTFPAPSPLPSTSRTSLREALQEIPHRLRAADLRQSTPLLPPKKLEKGSAGTLASDW